MNEHEREMELLEQERIEERQDNQKRMAWVAMTSMILFTIVLFSPLVSDSRLTIISEIASIFYFAQAGVVGAYMGSEAFVNRSFKKNLSRNSTNNSGPRIGR
jgi:hypothetical protein